MATIQGVYLALFGRPADPAGLAFFNGVTNNGANLAGIGPLQSSKEYTDRFAGFNNNTIINSIYQSLFNRDAEPAGLAFFVDALNKGTLTINNIAIAILDGAQGNDKTVLDNKLASAALFTAAIDTPTEIGAYQGNAAAALGRAFLADVTTTAKTAAQADTAVAGVVTSGAAGNTITLQAATNETLSLTVGAGAGTAVKSTDLNDTINATATNAWTAADTLDGAFGTDTLNATIDTNVTVAADGLKNIEILNVKVVTNATSVTVDNAKQLTQLWDDGSAKAFTANKVALTTTVGLKGAITELTTFNFDGATGTSDAATLSVNAATSTVGVKVDAIETLTVNNTGTSSVPYIDDAQLKSAVVTGSGTLTTNFSNGANTTVETVNASAYTGKITTNLTDLNAIKTYTGGTGVDAVTMDGAHTNDASIDLGGGNDTLTIAAAGVESKTLTVKLGAGSDIVTLENDLGNVQAVDTNANFIKTLITISDFNKAEDALKITTTTPASDRYTLLTAEQATVEAATDLLAAVQAAAAVTAVGKFSVFNYKGDAYVFDNVATAGLQAGDSIVKLTGVQVADLVASNFQIV